MKLNDKLHVLFISTLGKYPVPTEWKVVVPTKDLGFGRLYLSIDLKRNP
jgi:hypothetical protein